MSRNLVFKDTLLFGAYRIDPTAFDRTSDKSKRERILSKVQQSERCQRAKKYCGQHFGTLYAFLMIIAFTMAAMSVVIDVVVSGCFAAKTLGYESLEGNPYLQFLFWLGYTLVFIWFSTGFVHLVSPMAAGSGLPETKVILGKFRLKGFLSPRTFVAKVIGLAASMASGLPIGKEGPFVHIASCFANQLRKLRPFRGIVQNDAQYVEIIAAAAAVGSACSFGAPISGLLFSIEVTSAYFSVRSYFMGFFAAVCAACGFRILPLLLHEGSTMTAPFRTSFFVDLPFDVIELGFFSLLGAVCGVGGALFVWMHRNVVLSLRRNERLHLFLQSNRYLYPGIVASLFAALTFPKGAGNYIGGILNIKEQIDCFFVNVTWSDMQRLERETVDENSTESILNYVSSRDAELLRVWLAPDTSIFINLVVYIIVRFIMTVLAATLSVPVGAAITMFAVGSGFGRLVGEVLAEVFPDGIPLGTYKQPILPGGYAIVAAAAITGSTTHTVSISLLVAELTGDFSHMLPVMLSVIVANMVASRLQPSFFDSVIRIRELPYLPEIVASSDFVFKVFVEDFMVSNVISVSPRSTYGQIDRILESTSHDIYPFVDGSESRIFIGTVSRAELQHLLDEKLRDIDLKRLDELSKLEETDNFELDIDDVESNKLRGFVKSKGGNILMPLGAFTKPARNEAGGAKERGRRRSSGSRRGSNVRKASSLPDLEQVVAKITIDKKNRRVADLSETEKRPLLAAVMGRRADMRELHIDPSPFHLDKRTTLHKVHSIFSLLGLRIAYVTRLGRLVGVVTLKEIQRAIQYGPVLAAAAEDKDNDLDDDPHHSK